MENLPAPHQLSDAVRLAVARARGTVLGRLPAREELPAPPPGVDVDGQRLQRLQRLNGQLRGALSVVHEIADELPELPDVPPPALTEEERTEQRERLRRRLLQRRLEDLELSLAETLPFRVRTAWRIVREMARLKNLVSDDELLIDLPISDPDPWHESRRGMAPSARSWSRRLDATLIEALRLIAKGGSKGEGVPLLPPAVSAFWRDDQGLVRDDYDPGHDADLRSYLRAAGHIAAHHAMGDFETERGSEGELGLEGLLDPDTARACWPSRAKIVAFEEVVVSEARDRLAHHGQVKAREYLRDAHGLRPREIDSVIKMAASTAVELTDLSPEEMKALMVLRLEDYIERARDELNLSHEHRAHKLLALVQGISRMEAANPFAEFKEAVQSARESGNDGPDERPRLEVVDVPAIPPPP